MVEVRTEFHHIINPATWLNNGRVILVGREVQTAGEEGHPDIGNLVRLTLDEQHHVLDRATIWTPAERNVSYEDMRAIRSKKGQVLAGLTAVVREGTDYIPYPAMVRIDDPSLESRLPEVKIIEIFGSGKNMTPFNDQGGFVFRPEGEENNHRLVVLQTMGSQLFECGEIIFPQVPWASWRIGTTIPPIWLGNNLALMILHGIHKEKREDETLVYSLGRGLLYRDANRFRMQVDDKPLLTPDDFSDLDIRELHPKRRVIYACGGLLGPNGVYLFLNMGDTQTVEVTFSWQQLLAPCDIV